jgi:hypothetical protein
MSRRGSESLQLLPLLQKRYVNAMLSQLPPKTIVDVVDMSLAGSGYAREAWEMIKRSVLRSEDLTGEQLDRLDELFDRARDDLLGPGLRVDLSKDRIYM